MSENTKLKLVKFALTKVGKKLVSKDGYRQPLAMEHIRLHLDQVSDRWCTPACLCRTMYTRSSPTGKEIIRKKINILFKDFAKANEFLLIEYDNTKAGRGMIKSFKILEGRDELERQCAVIQINRMTRRKQLTDEMRDWALQATGILLLPKIE